MKSLKLALIMLLVSATSFAAVPQQFSTIGQRALYTSELFGFDIWLSRKSFVAKIEEIPKSGQVPAEAKNALCESNGPIDSVVRNNNLIESLSTSEPMFKELKGAYVKMQIASHMTPWLAYCAGNASLQQAVQAANANSTSELELASFMNELLQKYRN